MDRLVRRNVLALSGRAVEASGDVDVLLLDKTGTITIGNRLASEFIPMPGVAEAELAEVAQLASLVTAAATVEARRKAQRNAAKTIRSERAMRELQAQERAAYELARAGWAPARGPRFPARGFIPPSSTSPAPCFHLRR